MQGLFVRARHDIADSLNVAPPRLHQPTQVRSSLQTTRSRSCHEKRIVILESSIKALDHAVWRPALIKSTLLTVRVVGCGTSSPLILNHLRPQANVTKQN